MFGLHYLPNVVSLKLDVEKCNGCRMCVIVCPHAVFTVESRKAVIVDKDSCMECGACALNCAEEALTVDAGVGCAAGIIQGAIKGTEPTCDCGTDTTSCC
ncbi:MAG: mercury methylation ferredoxin HgcB [candidate division Zixibacteria bacterium]